MQSTLAVAYLAERASAAVQCARSAAQLAPAQQDASAVVHCALDDAYTAD